MACSPTIRRAVRRPSAGLVYIVANCYAAIGVIDYPERYCPRSDDNTGKRIIAGTKARLPGLWGGSPTSSMTPPGSAARSSARSTCWPRPCRSGRARATTWNGNSPQLLRLMQRIDAHPQVAPVLSFNWP